MLAHVEAEHLLLEREAVLLAELEIRDVHPIDEASLGLLLDRVAEQAHDPRFALATTGDGALDDALEHGAESLAGVTERVEPAGLDERLDRPLVQRDRVDPFAEVEEVGERSALLARRDDVHDHAFADVAHRRQPEPDRTVLHHEVAVGRVHVGDEHVDAALATLVEEDRGLVLVRLDAREQGGQVLVGVVRLEVRGLVRDVAVAERM